MSARFAIPSVSSVTRDARATEILATDPEAVVRELLARDPSVSELEIVRAGLEEARRRASS